MEVTFPVVNGQFKFSGKHAPVTWGPWSVKKTYNSADLGVSPFLSILPFVLTLDMALTSANS